MFNEPVDSYTNISDTERSTLLGQYVGPMFTRLGLRPGTKLTYDSRSTKRAIGVLIKDCCARARACVWC